MPSFRVPAFLCRNQQHSQRRSFQRLRSFHLTPADGNPFASQHALGGGTNPPPLAFATFDEKRQEVESVKPPTPVNMVIPIRGSTIVTLAIIASIFFIVSISFAFIGADSEEPYFMTTLNHVAETSPGIVLLGENVDVDVDEPAVTIRWSILACGEDFILPGSAGVHGSSACGLPLSPMHIYIDNDEDPTASYDPSQIPINRGTGQRRTVQNLVQFDSDHVLDVSEARLYPFDTYMLSSTIRAVSFDNQTIPIRKLATIAITSSFDTITFDMESFSSISTNGTEVQFGSRDLDMHITRPGEARFFALILFALSWVLTHITVGHVLLARRLSGLRSVLPHLISSGAIVIAIPQLRGTMPDAPGFDGVLIDSIGYFPQMIVSGISTVILLLIVAVREFDAMRERSQPSPPPPPPYYPSMLRGRPSHASNSSIISKFPRPPRLPNAHSSSIEIAQYEMHRMMKHLKGQYVFPPVQPSHRIEPSHSSKPSHRKVKTMSKIMENKEVSRWSDHED